MTIDDVPILEEAARGCGYRTEEATYLVTDDPMDPCHRLPIPLPPCEHCERKWQARAFTWFPTRLIGSGTCDLHCETCSMARPQLIMGERAGLIWVGEQHYETPADFMAEARERGISRRIQTVPNGFKLGETWILLAHVKACAMECPTCEGTGAVHQTGRDEFESAGSVEDDGAMGCPNCDGGNVKGPAIFTAFKPRQIQYVCTGEETEAELESLVSRGLTPVRVRKMDDDGNEIQD